MYDYDYDYDQNICSYSIDQAHHPFAYVSMSE